MTLLYSVVALVIVLGLSCGCVITFKKTFLCEPYEMDSGRHMCYALGFVGSVITLVITVFALIPLIFQI